MIVANVDTEVCAALLRGITDQLMADFQKPEAKAGLGDMIAGVRAVSERASQTLRRALSAHFPDVAWAKEEIDTADAISEGRHWIYDPIDGAYHFLQGLPLWSATLVLVAGGVPLFSLVYEPYSRDLYVAVRDNGATLNGARIRVSEKVSLETVVLGTAVPPRAAVTAEEHAQSLAQLAAITQRVFVVRPMASASLQLAYVAVGRLDGYWEVGHDVNDWLAGALLVREAGGKVSSFLTDEIGLHVEGIIAASEELHGQIREILL